MFMKVQISSDFPSGNIRVESIGETEIHLGKEWRDTAGKWFYWCFEARFDQPGK